MGLELLTAYKNKLVPGTSNVSREKVEMPSKSNHKIAKIVVPAVITGASAGAYGYIKQTKNTNMKYALFAKNELKKFYNDPEANKPCQGLRSFKSNPVSQYKAIPQLISSIEEELLTAKGAEQLNLESLKLQAKQLLNNHEKRFLAIKSAFMQKFIKQTIAKTSLYAAGGLAIGGVAGVLYSRFSESRKANHQ